MDYAIGPPPTSGDKDSGSIILAIDGLVFGISWSMVLLRLGTRAWITRNLGWDDATIFLAALTNSVGLAFYVCMVLYGLGRHIYYLSHYDFKMFLKWDYLDWIQAILTLAISKISICLLLLRLSKFSALKKSLYWLIVFIATTHLPLLILMVVQCRPVEKAWNTVIDGQCFSKNMNANILVAQGAPQLPAQLEVNFGIIAACLPIMKPLYAYLHSLYTGVPLERPRRTSTQTRSSSRTHRAWYRLRTSRSVILPRRASQPQLQATAGTGTTKEGSVGSSNRQYTWRNPLPEMPWRGFRGRQGQEGSSEGLELPMQGIEKRVDFSVDTGSVREGSRDEGKAQVALDEIL
ncbi:MAG: hypothetical protein Q9169_006757 [Polycauliona sp. 2 TL-2023]